MEHLRKIKPAVSKARSKIKYEAHQQQLIAGITLMISCIGHVARDTARSVAVVLGCQKQKHRVLDTSQHAFCAVWL